MLLYQADIAGLIPDMLISGPLDLRFEYQAPLIFVYKNMGNHSVKECAARSYTTWCLHSQTCARLRANELGLSHDFAHLSDNFLQLLTIGEARPSRRSR